MSAGVVVQRAAVQSNTLGKFMEWTKMAEPTPASERLAKLVTAITKWRSDSHKPKESKMEEEKKTAVPASEIEAFVRWRVCSLSSQGIHHSIIEKQVLIDLESFKDGSKYDRKELRKWIGRQRVRSAAYSWSKVGEKRKLELLAEEIAAPKTSKQALLVKLMEQFPDKILVAEGYKKLQQGLGEAVVLDSSTNKDNKLMGRVRAQAGFKSEAIEKQDYWVRVA